MKLDLAINHFNKSYFWDCEPKEIKLRSHIILIIERVLSQSLDLENDLIKLENLYSKSKIKKIAISSKQIFGNERIEKISNKYNLNPLSFVNYYQLEK